MSERMRRMTAREVEGLLRATRRGLLEDDSQLIREQSNCGAFRVTMALAKGAIIS